jgi:AcrR family transcriptional regulator
MKVKMEQHAKRPRGRPSAKDDILDAAEAVVIEKGAVHLTLDAVTERAGISKGGLRYHFDSKDALLAALGERQLKRYEAAWHQCAEEFGEGNQLLGYLIASTENRSGADAASASLMAVAANNPKLLGPVRDYFRDRFAVLSAEAGFEQAAIVNLATEGLWIMEMLQISPFEGAERDRALEALRRFAKGDLA